MGDGARIQDTILTAGFGLGYVSRPGLAQGGDRFGYQALLGARLDTFVSEYNSFQLILGVIGGREEAFGDTQQSATVVGGTVEAYLPIPDLAPVLWVGLGATPSAYIPDNGGSPEFELGVTARLAAVVGYAGLVLSVTGGLRPANMELSSFGFNMALCLNLPD